MVLSLSLLPCCLHRRACSVLNMSLGKVRQSRCWWWRSLGVFKGAVHPDLSASSWPEEPPSNNLLEQTGRLRESWLDLKTKETNERLDLPDWFTPSDQWSSKNIHNEAQRFIFVSRYELWRSELLASSSPHQNLRFFSSFFGKNVLMLREKSCNCAGKKKRNKKFGGKKFRFFTQKVKIIKKFVFQKRKKKISEIFMFWTLKRS